MHAEVLLLGAVTGLGYGLAAAALVVVFRVGGTVDLSLGQAGSFGAVVLLLLRDNGLGWWLAAALALLAGALVTAVIHALVESRLRHEAAALRLVATAGASVVLLRAGEAIAPAPRGDGLFPGPPHIPAVDIGALRILGSQLMLAALALPLAVAATRGLRRARWGRALRALSADRQAAEVLGVRPWPLILGTAAAAGATATLVSVLTLPAGGFATAEAFGPGVLLRILTAAAVAGFASPGRALVGGVGVGIAEAVILDVTQVGALVPVALLVTIAGAVVARGWPAASGWTPRLATRVHWWVLGVLAIAGTVAATRLGAGDRIAWALAISVATVAAAARLVIVLTGELPLGWYALAGIGGALAAKVGDGSGSALAGIAVALVLTPVAASLAALGGRKRAMSLAVVSWALALVVAGPALRTDRLLGGGIAAPSVGIGGPVASWLACIVVVAVAERVIHSGFGRRARALRDDPTTAIGLGAGPVSLRLRSIALGGAMCAVAGAALAQAVPVVRADLFGADSSIQAVAAAVVGGLGDPIGLVGGCLLVLGLPHAGIDGGTVTAVWLALLLWRPRGLMPVVAARRRGAAPAGRLPVTEGVALRATGLRCAFGDNAVVDGAALDVGTGEIVGIAGANGTGKTTLLRLLSGARTPDLGAIAIDDEDVTAWTAAQRSRRDVVALADGVPATLTAVELVLVGCERPRRPGLLNALLGRGTRSADVATAHAALDAVGLLAEADRPLGELSTGQQRRVALAAARASGARLLLLDEPVAGVATAERPLIAAAIRAAGATTVVVDHDRQFLDAAADRTLEMSQGRLAPVTPVAPPPARVRAVAKPASPALSVRGLTIDRGRRTILRDLELDVAAGEIMAILGPNGAGKSTLLAAVAGALPAAAGTVSLDGITMTGGPAARRRRGIALVPPPGARLAGLTTGEVLALARGARHVDRADTQAVQTLSNGEHRLLQLTAALACDPRILLVDELTLGLSPAHTDDVLRRVAEAADAGVAVLVADQHAETAARIADRVLTLDALDTPQS